MKLLRLERPLVCFDLETTGPDVTKDRIVQIAMIRVEPDGSRRAWESLVDPEVPIPPEATRVHGITDDDVRGAPPLAKLAPRILETLEGADVAGFNSARFDLPLLAARLAEAGHTLDVSGRRHVDALRIYHERERRDLAAAYRLYCGRELVGAHSALADAEATLEVLEGQLAKYDDLPREIDGLHEVCVDRRFVDADRKFQWDGGGDAVFAFSKHRGRRLREVAAEEPGFLKWMLNADFTAEVRQIVREALAGRFPRRGA